MTTSNENAQATASTALALDPTPMKTVVVIFGDADDREFIFFAPTTARVGDYAVVYAKGVHAARGPFSIGKIERETADIEGKAKQAILGTFNEEFARYVEQRMAHLANIKAQLQAKKRAFEEQQFFELMAEKDPEARDLLEQLKQFRV